MGKRKKKYTRGDVKVDAGIYYYKGYTIQKIDRFWKYYERLNRSKSSKALHIAIKDIDKEIYKKKRSTSG
jgi:hypothetical protein